MDYKWPSRFRCSGNEISLRVKTPNPAEAGPAVLEVPHTKGCCRVFFGTVKL